MLQNLFWIILALLALYFTRPSEARTPTASEISEKALIDCLNGKPIQVGDAYFTCNEMRIPGVRK